jgi:ABA DEFICIENT 4-like
MMSAEHIFSIANLLSVLCWILLAFLPARRWVTDVVTGLAAPALFAVAYVAIVIVVFPKAEGSFSTLAGVTALFADPWLLLAGWLHYLAFDLVIGTWEARDSVERGVPRWLLVPCLSLTLMFGPMGWLIYMVARMRYGTSPARA